MFEAGDRCVLALSPLRKHTHAYSFLFLSLSLSPGSLTLRVPLPSCFLSLFPLDPLVLLMYLFSHLPCLSLPLSRPYSLPLAPTSAPFLYIPLHLSFPSFYPFSLSYFFLSSHAASLPSLFLLPFPFPHSFFRSSLIPIFFRSSLPPFLPSSLSCVLP